MAKENGSGDERREYRSLDVPADFCNLLRFTGPGPIVIVRGGRGSRMGWNCVNKY